MIYSFEGHSLDCERRELRRGENVVAVEPQVFDLLQCLIAHRARVLSKDELLAKVWNGRIVSESTLSSRIATLRQAVGDNGAQQRLIRTVARKGFRFVGVVREDTRLAHPVAPVAAGSTPRAESAATPVARSAMPERRSLTIMACGLVGVESLASRLDPEDLREVMRAYGDCVKGVVERYGGSVAKRGADGVLAVFGYPHAHEDDAARAVRAGLATTLAVTELRSHAAAEAMQLRVGIATGLVVVGDMHAEDAAADLAVVGETPHMATRLMLACDAGTVAVSAGTRQLIGGLFVYRDLADLVAGPTEPVRVWQVLRESATANRFEALRPSRGQLIGREEELELLLRRWHRAKTGEGRVALVWGEPGIGKSHLVAALQEALGRERHACLRYFCAPHRAQTALHPVVAQMENAAGFAPADSNDGKLDKLARLLALSSESDVRDLTLFADLLSIPTGGRCTALSISAQRRKDLLLERFVARLAGLAAHMPVLMVLEDAHWVDPTTRELFDVLIDRLRTLPVLFIMTYRPEFAPPWLGQSHVTTLTLTRLDRRATATLVGRVAGGKHLPQALLEQIVVKSDGVPLFIEEVTKSVLESRILREEEGAYVLDGALHGLAVPATLQASLIARLDRLDAAHTLIQTCAALGREFSYEVLKAVTALTDAELEAPLRQLVASELVHQRGSVPHAAYTFKHVLVQDAAYETLLKSQRLQIHRRIAAVFEHDFSEITTRHPDVLAYHCREAGLAEKAIDFSIRAARTSLERSAGVEAQAQVESAMALLPGISAGPARLQLEGRLQVALADALMMTQGFASPLVMNALSRARDLLDETEQPNESIRALCGLFNYHLMRSESSQCLDLVSGLAKRRLDRPTASVMHYLVGAAQLHLGHFGESIRHLQQALSFYDEEVCQSVAFVAGYHLRSFMLIWLGLGYLYVGSIQQASDTICAAVQDARSRSHPFTLVSALLALARFRHHMHDLQGAIVATEEGLAIATEQRSPYHLSRANILRALNVVDSGRVGEGIVLLEQALATHRDTGANFQSSYNLSRLAEAYARAGRLERAMQLADDALAEVARTGERWWEAEARRIRGEILLVASPAHAADAEQCFKAALDCARRQSCRLWERQAVRSLARLHRTQGLIDEASELEASFRSTEAGS